MWLAILFTSMQLNFVQLKNSIVLFSYILKSVTSLKNKQQKEFLFIAQISPIITYANLCVIWHRQAYSLTLKNFPKDLCHSCTLEAHELLTAFHLPSWIIAQVPAVFLVRAKITPLSQRQLYTVNMEWKSVTVCFSNHGNCLTD